MMTEFLNQANLRREFKCSEVFLGVDLHVGAEINLYMWKMAELLPSAQPQFVWRKGKKKLLLQGKKMSLIQILFI